MSQDYESRRKIVRPDIVSFPHVSQKELHDMIMFRSKYSFVVQISQAFGSRGMAFVFFFKTSDAGIEFNVTTFVDNKVK